MTVAGRLTDTHEFEQLVLQRTTNGGLVLLRDVGTAELGAKDLYLVSPLMAATPSALAYFSSPIPMPCSWRPPSARR